MFRPFPIPLLFALFSITIAMAAPTPSVAQPMLPRSATAVYEIARTFGEIEFDTPDREGRPVLHGDMDGIYYSVVLFGCDAPDGCESVQFYATFISDENSTLAFVNDWNLEKRWVTAFLNTDGDVVITMTTNIRHGVSRQNFMDTLDVWRNMMIQFNDRIYGIGPTPPAPPRK